MTDATDELRRMDKEIRALRRKLHRAEEERRVLEVVNDQNQSLLRAIHAEVERSRAVIERQNEQLRALYEQIVAEQKVSESLLLNILPRPIAERLKARADVIADTFPEVTVLFADIVGFTRLSATVSPEELVVMLNAIFTEFDELADRHGLEKIKTIGDAYMAAAGLPEPRANHAECAARLALDMIAALERFNRTQHAELQVRIGLNTGAVVAGVIGKRKFIYDLWGDAVNTASRMESHGLAGRVQMTDTTRMRLPDSFRVEERGVIDVKGKGPLRTWLLVAAE
ncbi:MAG: adenylate/guanylate cyclase domain-containing protein [Myxococcota bacterium]